MRLYGSEQGALETAIPAPVAPARRGRPPSANRALPKGPKRPVGRPPKRRPEALQQPADAQVTADNNKDLASSDMRQQQQHHHPEAQQQMTAANEPWPQLDAVLDPYRTTIQNNHNNKHTTTDTIQSMQNVHNNMQQTLQNMLNMHHKMQHMQHDNNSLPTSNLSMHNINPSTYHDSIKPLNMCRAIKMSSISEGRVRSGPPRTCSSGDMDLDEAADSATSSPDNERLVMDDAEDDVVDDVDRVVDDDDDEGILDELEDEDDEVDDDDEDFDVDCERDNALGGSITGSGPLGPLGRHLRQYQRDGHKKLFPHKLWDLVHNSQYQHCLRWSQDGLKVYLNRSRFESSYLRTPSNQFHTQKAISFVRQMNMYGFRKVDDSYYENDNFRRDHKHLLRNMMRRHPNRGGVAPLQAVAQPPRPTSQSEPIEAHPFNYNQNQAQAQTQPQHPQHQHQPQSQPSTPQQHHNQHQLQQHHRQQAQYHNQLMQQQHQQQQHQLQLAQQDLSSSSYHQQLQNRHRLLVAAAVAAAASSSGQMSSPSNLTTSTSQQQQLAQAALSRMQQQQASALVFAWLASRQNQAQLQSQPQNPQTQLPSLGHLGAAPTRQR